eukprot:1161585-Pelagomonas_calceolata.AAC.8
MARNMLAILPLLSLLWRQPHCAVGVGPVRHDQHDQGVRVPFFPVKELTQRVGERARHLGCFEFARTVFKGGNWLWERLGKKERVARMYLSMRAAEAWIFETTPS